MTLSEHDVVTKVAGEAKLSEEQVDRVLKCLAKLAYSEGHDGFPMPGFGDFQVVTTPDKKGVNPFTGKPTMFKGKEIVEFRPSSKARRAFLEGRKQVRGEKRSRTPEKRLPEIRLSPNEKDLSRAGLATTRATESCSKLGGKPDWLQGPPENLDCCGTKMSFYGQFDSAVGGEFLLMDVGRLYVFLCWNCLTPKGVIQSY